MNGSSVTAALRSPSGAYNVIQIHQPPASLDGQDSPDKEPVNQGSMFSGDTYSPQWEPGFWCNADPVNLPDPSTHWPHSSSLREGPEAAGRALRAA